MAASTMIAGCSIGPQFLRPDAPTPKAWHATAAEQAAAWPAPDWWRGFGSAELDARNHARATEEERVTRGREADLGGAEQEARLRDPPRVVERREEVSALRGRHVDTAIVDAEVQRLLETNEHVQTRADWLHGSDPCVE